MSRKIRFFRIAIAIVRQVWYNGVIKTERMLFVNEEKTARVRRLIAKNMAELRRAYPLTQAELAERINYSDKAVSKWERGDGMPDVVVLGELAELYGVSIEYFLADHTGEKPVKIRTEKRVSKTHLIVTLTVVAAIWLLATAAFVIAGIIAGFSGLYLIFVGAVPVTAIVVLVFNTLWGERKYNIIIESVILWTVLITLYLSLLNYNLWAVFLIGVPTQVVLVLVDRLIANIIADKSSK